ncbi:PQQ-binding-like beta-propeller repeat protein [Streptomyces sp. PKU-EA00015]|uniref:outer membrane protein assembly factor BamB family protein n=1 Tax=Streptomyces sp. PKU-EA00015 TaxID=2748326 RepID=UPI0015A36706|nr:PQQ-binding-like beta-propeller repeat protein [Streptomyces sp. PKU-EA00015]NWF24992.1 PQQ-binding-like beta-propeller repeat protein [Streptomyces sp. PKU-EA00015]
MEPLQPDDPGLIGPYRTLARVRESASSVRFLAVGPNGAASVVALVRPRLAASRVFRRRFRHETRRTEQLAGGWVQPVVADVDGPLLWTASAYVPALTLREAIALAGPLPGRAVRILGAALAETLSRVHATGTVLHGLSPDTVLLAADGPRVTALGALGAAAVAEADADGQMTVKLGYLTPEQATGAQPGPASDLFVLGQLLAYAATGTTPLADADRIAHGEPELSGVPEELRPVLASCLAKVPGERPPAAAVAADLALEGASALARDGWLPDALLSALAAQESETATLVSGGGTAHGAAGSAVEPAARSAVAPGASPAASADGGGGRAAHATAGNGHVVDRDTVLVRRAGGAGRDTTPLLGREPLAPAALPVPARAALPAVVPPVLPVVTTAPAQDPGIARRGLLVAAAAGVAGLVVGGGAVYALAGDGEDTTAPARPAPAPRPSRMAGLAPEPTWRYAHPATGDQPVGATVWRDRLLLVTDGERMTGVDLRTGRRRWELPEAASTSRPVPVDTTFCLVDTADALLWVSAEDGRPGHRVAKQTLAQPGESLTIGNVMGADGPSVWFTAHVRRTVEKTVKKRKRKVEVRETYVIAYDLAGRKQLWRARVPDGRAPYTPRYQLVAVRPGEVLVRQDGHTLTPAQRKASRNGTVLLAFDRGTGKALASVPLSAVAPTAAVTGDATGRLYAASGGELHAYSGPDGKRQWRVAAADARGESGVFAFGTAAFHGPTLYVANRYQQVCAVDTATGRPVWRRSTEAPVWRETPSTALSTSGRTVLAGDAAQLTAFSARDGRRLWKFQEAGVTDAEEQAAPRYTAMPAGDRGVLVRRGPVFYALPVD